MAGRSSDYQKRIIALRRKIVLLVVLLSVMFALIIVLLVLMAGQGNVKDDRIPVVSRSDSTQSIGDVPIYPLFVGDSRTVGMAAALEENIDYHAQNGSAYSYLTSLDQRIRTSGSDCIIIGFGVNDMGDIADYTAYANTLGRELDKPVYFLTVNPVDEQKAARNGYHLTNSRIDSFNEELVASAENYRIIDTNGFLSMAGYDTVDGLHYDNKTYIKIYEFIMRTLQTFARQANNR